MHSLHVTFREKLINYTSDAITFIIQFKAWHATLVTEKLFSI